MAWGSPVKELEEGLGSANFYLLSKLGCVCLITKELRYMPCNLGGIGLYNLTTKTKATTLNAFLQHFRTKTPLSITLQATLENLQMVLGVAGCPFDYNYDKRGECATPRWVKSLWKKIWKLGLEVDIDYKPLKPP